MTRDEIRRQFIDLLSKAAQVPDKNMITDDTSLIKDLGINSVKVVDLVLETEDKFGIEIDGDSMDKFYTVRDAVDMIWEKTKTAA